MNVKKNSINKIKLCHNPVIKTEKSTTLTLSLEQTCQQSTIPLHLSSIFKMLSILMERYPSTEEKKRIDNFTNIWQLHAKFN